jgi:hypothetical protein
MSSLFPVFSLREFQRIHERGIELYETCLFELTIAIAFEDKRNVGFLA